MFCNRLTLILMASFLPATRAVCVDQSLDVFSKRVHPVLIELCDGCHGRKKSEGGIRLDRLDPDLVNGSDSEIWHDVFEQLKNGEMPPAKAKQPEAEQRKILTQWLVGALQDSADAKRGQDGRVVTRRLTRYEYQNTMRDLLLIDLDFAQGLPPDPASQEGFQNNGSTLEMSPTQIEQYLDVARRSLSEAIVTGDRPRLYEVSQNATATGKLPTTKFAGHAPVRPEFILDLMEFPRTGPFELKVRARAAIPAGEGVPRIRVSMGNVPGIIHVPRGEIGEAEVDTISQTITFHGRMEDFPQPGPISFGNSGFKGMIVMIDFVDADGNELRYPDHTYTAKTPPLKKQKKDQDAAIEPDAKKEPVAFGGRLEIEVQSVEFQSPVYASWPPPSHERLFFASPHVGNESLYIRDVLKRFMESAFRRSVLATEVEQMAKLFEKIRADSETFEDAARETLAAVLVSPSFLYIVEQQNQASDDLQVTDFELASRLSYFLWSTAPDQQLMDLARQGQLKDAKVLKQQVERMLEDEQASEFVRHFVTQWLDLGGLDRVAVNPEFFPGFDNKLKTQMRNETLAFFSEILRADRSALELLDSDWVMLNRPMASHYGLTGPRSQEFEQVTLASDDARGGLLGQAAFLLANSNGEDSHPIKRAVWILDRLLGSPPASPPADVPDLDTDNPDLAKMTLKQKLAVHSSKESCGSCHREIDPWGIPLENFDAVGRWRAEIPQVNRRDPMEIDTVGILPSGVEIEGPTQLKRYLVESQSERFAKAIVKRLMAYGLGRSLDFADRLAVDELTEKFVENDYRLRALLVDFVQSKTFRTK